MSENAEQSQEKKPKKDDNDFDLLAGPLAESLFVIVPLIVLTIVGVYKGKSFLDIISSSEWAFGAAVFFGQGIVKVVQALTISHNTRIYKINGERITFLVAVIIVLGFIPSLITLALILITEKPSFTFISLQMVMFLLGLTTFIIAGAAVKGIDDKKYQKIKDELEKLSAKVSS
jgi:hypothetical protein